jgi:hypothetical protein
VEGYHVISRREKRVHKWKKWKQKREEDTFQGPEHLRNKDESKIICVELNKGHKDFKHRITLCRNN